MHAEVTALLQRDDPAMLEVQLVPHDQPRGALAGQQNCMPPWIQRSLIQRSVHQLGGMGRVISPTKPYGQHREVLPPIAACPNASSCIRE